MTENSFSNNQVFFGDHPDIQMLEFQPLEPNKLKVEWINTTISFLILILGAFGLKWFDVSVFEDFGWYIMSSFGVIYIMMMVLIYLGFNKKKYAVRERDITYKQGLIWSSTTVLPFNRVQHCEVSEGPIDRLFGLSELKVFTAGGSSSDLSISGLTPNTANKIKEYIVKKTADEEE